MNNGTTGAGPTRSRRRRSSWRVVGYMALAAGVLTLGAMFMLLRMSMVTDYMYHRTVKDPERSPPSGPVIVAPADGTVLYVRKITDGVIPEVVKRGVRVPIIEHMKAEPLEPFGDGWLIGIYMNTHSVHINRMPDNATIKRRVVFNGPHMDMTRAETKIILTSMVPGLVSIRKLLRMAPYNIEDEADFVLKSARETLMVENERGGHMYIVRIGDFYVGKILTWVSEGQTVARGEKIGMISWGSQTDLFIEATPNTEVSVQVGDFVYAGETVVATY